MIIIKNPKTLIKSGHLVVQDGKVSKCDALESSDSLVSLDDRQIMVPGFINLHCHLAYSDLQIPKQNLFSWILELVNTQKTKNLDFEASSLNGAKEALSFGTTFLIDNTMHVKESINAFQKTGLKGIVGLEVFGSNPEDAEEIFLGSLNNIKSFTDLLTPRVRPPQSEASGPFPAVGFETSKTFYSHTPKIFLSFSPHAPYDVSKKLWKLLLNFSKE